LSLLAQPAAKQDEPHNREQVERDLGQSIDDLYDE